MPYIPKNERRQYKKLIKELKWVLQDHPIGHLVYVLSAILLPNNYAELGSWKFVDYNERLGAITVVKTDFERRYLGMYEDGKVMVNGEILE